MGKSKPAQVEPNDEHDNSELASEIDNFGVSFIFERALRRLDVQTEQRRLQQDKFDGRLKQLENDNLVLEQRLTNKNRDFDKLKDKFVVIQKQLVAVKTENDILDMKLQAELKNTHRLSRDVENLQWSKNEIMTMVNKSRNIEELRQKIMSRRLY